MLIDCDDGGVTALQRDRNRSTDECPVAASSNVVWVKALELAA